MSVSQLSVEQVARTALAVLDAEGLGALNMRRLAADLGIGTMTLYGYFRSKEELLAGVVDVAFAEWEPPAPGRDWRETAQALALSTWDLLRRHPVLVQLRGETPIFREQAFRITEPAVAALRAGGLPPAEAARAFRTLFVYVFGSAMFSPREASAEERRALRMAYAGLDPGEFPTLTSMPEEAADALGGDEQFRFGLEVVLDGIAARTG